jgi:outer membrane lipoprotein SlyB
MEVAMIRKCSPWWSRGAAAIVLAVAMMSTVPAVAATCNGCGVVQNVRQVETKGEASGVGAVAGGVIGGVIGHQFGSGRGNTAATIAGAGAGAYAGHQVEKNRNRKSYWSVAVKMDDGRTRTFTLNNRPEFREGDRVKAVEGGKRLALVAN